MMTALHYSLIPSFSHLSLSFTSPFFFFTPYPLHVCLFFCLIPLLDSSLRSLSFFFSLHVKIFQCCLSPGIPASMERRKGGSCYFALHHLADGRPGEELSFFLFLMLYLFDGRWGSMGDS